MTRPRAGIALMSRERSLALLFALILAAPPGCTLLFGPCDPSDTQSTRTVPAAALAEALADGVLMPSECAALCEGEVSASSSGAPTSGEPTATTDGGADASSSGTTGASDTSGTDTGGTDTGATDSDATDTGAASTGTSGAVEGAGRAEPMDLQASLAPRPYAGELKYCSAAGTDAVVCVYAGQECASGRRPAGLHAVAGEPLDSPGAWLAATAHLEAASVPAFERLADELRSHGAPGELQAAARAAAADERRHAAGMTAAARRYGARPPAFVVDPPRPRSLAALARENAVEGCVRETWAALLAAYQAMSAEDPAFRALMAEVAVDERRHAELAWAIDAWARTRLSAAEVRELDDALAGAAAALRPSVDPPAPLAGPLGLPQLARAEPMWRALTAVLWDARSQSLVKGLRSSTASSPT